MKFQSHWKFLSYWNKIEFMLYLCAWLQGHPTGNFEKKTQKQQQSVNKVFWDYFKQFGRLLEKNYLFQCSGHGVLCAGDREVSTTVWKSIAQVDSTASNLITNSSESVVHMRWKLKGEITMLLFRSPNSNSAKTWGAFSNKGTIDKFRIPQRPWDEHNC